MTFPSVRPPARLVHLFTAVVVALAVVLAPGSVAAVPTPAELEKQIDKEWNLLEPIIEPAPGRAGPAHPDARRYRDDAVIGLRRPQQPALRGFRPIAG